ncbi:Molybdopterin-guanine dinucleotide biosynthesis protein MobB [hydrothermal vent metagenome]|uniref:Molybdopterin-guanine dinucleotide biosynthesis protein MobB n=1 Tax=hydrothermal vent metagenome TaxID=652676 RepID=A0A3B0WN20_9ZZZZ
MNNLSLKTGNITFKKPLLGFAAFSGTGKTTLLLKLIPELKQRGLRIAVVKHAHHNFDMDTPGKDSYELRKAGAAPMLICSSMRTVITIENEIEAEPMLDTILNHIPADTVDMVLVEGFKKWPFNKIELHRELTGKPLLYPNDSNIIAIAHDNTQPLTNTELPQLDINDINAVADFVMKYAQHYCAT